MTNIWVGFPHAISDLLVLAIVLGGTFCFWRRRTRSKLLSELSRHQLLHNAILTSITDPILVVDREKRLLVANPAAHQILGLTSTPGQNLNFTAKVSLPSGGFESLLNHLPFEPSLEKGTSHQTTLLVRQPGFGELVWFSVHTNPLRDPQGAIIGAVTVFRDITQIERTEQELKRTEHFFQATLDSLRSPIAILAESGHILEVNDAWKKFAQENGLNDPDFGLGTNYLDICDQAAAAGDELAAQAAAGIRQVLNGKRDEFELEYPCHSPTQERWFTLKVTRFYHEGLVRAVAAHIDITQRVLAERAARENRDLFEAIQSMEQVLSIVGHELRTPLAAIRMMSELLLPVASRAGLEAQKIIESINNEVVRLTEMVNHMLEAARIRSGAARWTWGPVDIARACQAAADLIQPLLQQRPVELLLQTADLPDSMLGDQDAIERLLINLLTNAAHHTTAGRITLTTQTLRDAIGSWLLLTVRDTGPGIDPVILPHLGKPFRLNAGVVGKGHIRGTGLGLAICCGICAAHGGTLSVRTAPGQGSTFTARLRTDLSEPQPVGRDVTLLIETDQPLAA